MRLLVLLLATLFSGPAVPQAHPASPVVVELFTSEGCSSCPPADALLMALDQHGIAGLPQVIVLGEHVDYWNHQGWTDRFSSAEFTQRQQQYVRRFRLHSAYTPQMVVDGQAEMVGNDRNRIVRAIANAAGNQNKAQLAIEWQGTDHVCITFHSDTPVAAQVVLAVTEDGLSTAVKDGENNGHTLRHAGVVRALQPLGTTSNGAFEMIVKVPSDSTWKKENLKLVAFAQEPKQGRILGASSTEWQH